IALSLAAPGWPAVKLDQRKALTSEAAKQIAAAALKVATANQYKVTIVIVDEGGHLLYLERMDDSNPSGVDTASAKATAAVMYKQPTKNFADRLAHGEMLVLKLPGAMPVEGGFPLVVEGKVIGGISVGGAPKGQLDAQVAQAGVDWLAANLK
ncbi:MAG: heme-binding protein, partial [Candidatus Solibacter sp.]|nr:heme-binding protein [Candidatus Solibacter sp.]